MKNNLHPQSLAPLSVLLRLIAGNRGIPRRYWGRAAGLLALSALTSPLRIAEQLRYGARMDRVELAPPLFILGFARSGTTHLQNLISQDAQFGCCTTWQGIASPFALMGRGVLKRLVEKGMASQGELTRPMDNVKVSLDAPTEEDLALANTSPMSFIHQLSFPQQTERMFNRYVLLRARESGRGDEGLSPDEQLRWERAYLRVLRKASLLADGKPLMLRNTVNLGRVEHLLRLFPQAKFINIVRNPYDVYPSMLHLYRTLLSLYQLDDYDWAPMHEFLVDTYKQLMQKYLRDRERIPPGHLAEVRYENLERNPVGELARLYDELALPGWDDAKPNIEAYLDTLSGYRKNALQMAQEDINLVSERWGFAIDAWGYAAPRQPAEAR